MKTVFPKIFFFILLLNFCQYPIAYSQCLWIKRILVDACVPGGGCTSSLSPACSCEGKNEMVLLHTGSQSISISNIVFDWPNNSWKGIVFPNAITSAITADLQASVMGCGKLLEPQGGMLPPNKDVLFILSTDMCVSANSFANLQDTLYVIFQNEGNFQGHFANANATTSLTPRITSFTVTGSPSCTGSVSYIPAYLTSTAGVAYSVTQNYSSPLFDGGAVQYDAVGNPTYVNIGCNAPFTPMQVQVQTSTQTLCTSSAVQLTASVMNGTYNQISWSGGQGSFAVNNSTSAVNIYSPGINEYGIVTLTCIATRTCGTITGSAQTTFTLNVFITPTIQLLPSYSICSGQNLVLQPTISPVSQTGPQSYSWSTGSSQSTININSPGSYNFSVSGACGNAQASTQVNLLPLTTLQILAPPPPHCSQVTLTALTNGTTYIWNGTPGTSTFLVQQSGNYTLASSGTCNSPSAIITITIIPQPTLVIQPSQSISCSYSSPFSFTAQSNANVLWQGTFSQTVFTPSASGIYTALASNSCGQTSATVSFTLINVTASFVAQPPWGNAPLNVSVINQSSNATTYFWNFGNNQTSNSTNASVTYENPGDYTLQLIATNGPCSDTSSITIKVMETFGPIPELITPNGDGKNDTWEIRGILSYKNAEAEIYNRWGNLVYRKAPYKNEWDGHNNVIPGNKGRLPAGSYFYILYLHDSQNRIFKGHVRLEY